MFARLWLKQLRGLDKDHITTKISICPSIILTAFSVQGRRGAGAYSSCHWMRGRVHPGTSALYISLI